MIPFYCIEVTMDFLGKKTVDTSNLSYEDWQRLRKNSVGGSDVASILGISKFRGKLSVWHDKCTDVMQEDNPLFEWGRRLEPVVADKFADAHPDWKSESLPMIVYGDNEWESANIDRVITLEDGSKAILEIKTTDVSNSSDWDDDKVPDYYITQIQWYMGITGIKKGYFACLIGGNKYIEKEIDFDERLFSILQKSVEAFWLNHVVTGVPPNVETVHDAEAIKLVYPAERAYDSTIPIDSIEYIIAELEEVNKVVSEYTERKVILEGRCKEFLGNSTRGESSRYQLSWLTSKGAERVDTKKFKEEYPELYNRLKITGEPSRRFSLKRRKETV